jgi:peptidoglycan/xylan/chitin deacetylase (PgdA/CDA1 family)
VSARRRGGPGRWARELAALLLRLSGLHWLQREIFRRDRVAILLYHDPTPEALERHLRYLSKRYRWLSLRELVDAISAGHWSTLPPKSLVVTLDDGYAGNHRLLESFRRHGVVPTLYLCSHVVATGRRFWQEEQPPLVDELCGEDTARLLDRLREATGFAPEREYPERRALGAKQIEEMDPWVDFESHGRFHFVLPRCDDALARDELAGSRASLAERLGRSCDHFAYPFGLYGEREVRMVEECGYLSARTTDPGWNGPGSDPRRLKLLAAIPPDASLNVLRAHLSGVPNRVQSWLRSLRSLPGSARRRVS